MQVKSFHVILYVIVCFGNECLQKIESCWEVDCIIYDYCDCYGVLLFVLFHYYYFQHYRYYFVFFQRWCQAYRNDDFVAAVNTNNGIERQNESLKYDYLTGYNHGITMVDCICPGFYPFKNVTNILSKGNQVIMEIILVTVL